MSSPSSDDSLFLVQQLLKRITAIASPGAPWFVQSITPYVSAHSTIGKTIFMTYGFTNPVSFTVEIKTSLRQEERFL